MQLTNIRTSAFQGARQVDIRMTRPVNLIHGGNGRGKSSIRDAVVIALTGDPARVKRKGDYGLMITEGYQAALAEVIADGTVYTAALNKSGKLTHSHKSRDVNPVLPFVLDAQRFASLPVDQRRILAFQVLGVAHDHAAIAARMRSRGLDKDRVAQVSNFLRVGFDAALEEAKRNASEARAGWKAETGETYGSIKAAKWRAPEPEFTGADIGAMQGNLKELDAELAAANQDSGGLVATARIVGEARTNIESLRGQAEKVERCRDKLAADQAGLVAAQGAHDSAADAADAAPKQGMLHDLARSLDYTLRLVAHLTDPKVANAGTTLDAYEAIHGAITDDPQGDPEAAARLPGLRSALELMQRSVANSQRDLAAAEAAAAEITRLERLIADNPVNSEDLADAKQNIDGLVAQRQQLAEELRAAEAAKEQGEQAAKRTDAAAKHHANVAAWDAIADALAPDGIQAEVLGESMRPLNERLQQSAVDTGWPAVFVRHDMAITAAGRPYELLSVSEQWRCDAMLAEALTFMSGLKLLMLDGMDVLEPSARPSLVAWLDVLAINGEIDTALVFATLATRPQGMPDSIECWEVVDGRCGEPESEEIAA